MEFGAHLPLMDFGGHPYSHGSTKRSALRALWRPDGPPFGGAWQRLRSQLDAHGKHPDTFPNALATMWCYITDDRVEAERILTERVVPTVHRPEEMLRARLPIGPPELFAEKLTAFANAGVQASSSGRSLMSATSWNASGTRCDHLLPHHSQDRCTRPLGESGRVTERPSAAGQRPSCGTPSPRSRTLDNRDHVRRERS